MDSAWSYRHVLIGDGCIIICLCATARCWVMRDVWRKLNGWNHIEPVSSFSFFYVFLSFLLDNLMVLLKYDNNLLRIYEMASPVCYGYAL
ncbi:hypothetical protein BC943DRAFT_95610 [Umbelopsis sp. AD052]|nr:hypothetical protein BC943DRAFT_95610 [Umbelopsis sp. AD052]